MTDAEYYASWIGEGMKLARLYGAEAFQRGAVADLEKAARELDQVVTADNRGLAIVTEEARASALRMTGWSALAGRLLQETALDGRRTQNELQHGQEWLLEVAKHGALAYHALDMADRAF